MEDRADKFLQLLPAGQRIIIFRPDELSSVIKKPADKDSAALPAPDLEMTTTAAPTASAADPTPYY
jgi:hypothetical protein